MKQTVKYSLRIEYEKSWKYLFHLLRVPQGVILELSHQITIRLCEVMNFCGTFCKNIARIKIYRASSDEKRCNSQRLSPKTVMRHFHKQQSGGFL